MSEQFGADDVGKMLQDSVPAFSQLRPKAFIDQKNADHMPLVSLNFNLWSESAFGTHK